MKTVIWRSCSAFMLALLLTAPLLAWAQDSSNQGQFWQYTFRPGDSLWKIARRFTNSPENWREIQRINRLRQGNSRKIQPGTRIVIPVAMLKVQPTPAIVIALNGEVRVLRASGRRFQPKIGSRLFSGDKIITGQQQSLRLQFADQSELQILSDSEVVLDKISQHKKTGMVDTRVRLNFGRVDSKVHKQNAKSRYQIRTPAALTAVRGTAFRLASGKDNISRTEVTEGTVAVSVGQSIKLVPHGFGIVAEKGKPLADPIKLLPAPQLSAARIDAKQVVRLSWQALDDANGYRYQLARDAKFGDLLQDQQSPLTALKLSKLAVGHYYFRVRAIDRNQLEGQSAAIEFNIAPPAVKSGIGQHIIAPIDTLILTL